MSEGAQGGRGGGTHQSEADNPTKQASFILHRHSWQLTQLVSQHSSQKLHLLPDVVNPNVQNVLQSNAKSQLQCTAYSRELITMPPFELVF